MLSNPKAHFLGLLLGAAPTQIGPSRENAQTVSSRGAASARLVALHRLLPSFKPEKYHRSKKKVSNFCGRNGRESVNHGELPPFLRIFACQLGIHNEIICR
jgi:hypothetical protein